MSFAIGLIHYVMKSDDTGSMPGLYIVKIHLLKPIDLHGWIAIMLCYWERTFGSTHMLISSSTAFDWANVVCFPWKRVNSMNKARPHRLFKVMTKVVQPVSFSVQIICKAKEPLWVNGYHNLLNAVHRYFVTWNLTDYRSRQVFWCWLLTKTNSGGRRFALW